MPACFSEQGGPIRRGGVLRCNDPEKFHGTFEQEAAARAVHNLNQLRTVRRAAVDPDGGDEGKDGC
jgi:hypothetical protein